MKNIFLALSLGFVSAVFFSCSSEDSAGTNSNYSYESVENDPMGVRIYTLKNGLKVYLSQNQDEPKVQTQISVRAGSKYDPSDCTGLAHYLEHMLFKGTSKIASLDWEKEKQLLKQISDLYEAHRNTDDANQKKSIYERIDSLSNQAAKYVAPNEFDKMLSSLGAERTNAFTSNEKTVYINIIPAVELEKWLAVESERFSELVLRLFHTELETVYEEFNKGQDNDWRKVFQKLNKNIYQKHPYGTQPTIGHGEHLKNPSMERIHDYFSTYYVPNNMCISLSGDLDFDKTIAMIDKYFGGMERKEVPKFTFEPEEPITEPRVDTVFGPQMESVWLAYRFNGINSGDGIYLKLIDALLNNGQAGLIDLNLIKKQLVQSAASGYSEDMDYSTFRFYGIARPEQKLDEVKDLILGQLDLIKSGDFDDWMLEAVIKDFRLTETKQLEGNWYRAYKMTNAFIYEQKWNKVLAEKEKLKKVTKQEIVDFANKHFKDNHVVVYKLQGEDPNKLVVEKPKITPIDIQRDTLSAFYKEFKKIESLRLDPLFIDYNEAIQTSQMKSGLNFRYIENKTNDLFYLYYVLEMGSDHDSLLSYALRYLPFLGTSKYSAEEIQIELFKLGLSYDIFESDKKSYVYLSGLEESLEKGVEIFEHVLSEVESNPEEWKKLIQSIKKSRTDSKLNKGTIMWSGLGNWAKYGPKNGFNDAISIEKLEALNPDVLTAKIKSLYAYNHEVFYYGTKKPKEVKSIVAKYHNLPENRLETPKRKEYAEQDMNENLVFYAEYDMVQTELGMVSKDVKCDKELYPIGSVFNHYFGSGLSSIVFQEIREGKALAYSAWSSFESPSEPHKSHYVRGYLGTQADKLGDAVAALSELMNDMPRSPDQFEDAKLSALKHIETSRITKTGIFWSYLNDKELGFTEDSRKFNYPRIQKLTLDDMGNFFNTHIKGKKYSYVVIGKKDNMDFELLNKIGTVKELTLEEIFGY